MPVNVVDLTDKLIPHLDQQDAEGYRAALEEVDPYFAKRYLRDLSGLGEDELEASVEHAAVGDYIEHVQKLSDQLTGIASDVVEEFDQVLDISELDTTVVVFPGLFTSNAFQGAKRGKSWVGVCTEHFCDLDHERCFKIPPDDLDIWLSHELTHSWRYTSHDSGSLFTNSSMGSGFLLERTAGTFANSIFAIDEGIAAHYSDKFTAKEDRDLLGMTDEHLEASEQIWNEKRESVLRLLKSRDEELFNGFFMSLGYFDFHGVEFPSRIGYYLGLQLVRELLDEHGLSEEELLESDERELFRTVLDKEGIEDRVLSAEEK